MNACSSLVAASQQKPAWRSAWVKALWVKAFMLIALCCMSWSAFAGSMPTQGDIRLPVARQEARVSAAFAPAIDLPRIPSAAGGPTPGAKVAAAATITLSPTGILPIVTVGQPYSLTLTASGGTAPYTFSIVSGAFAPGLSLSSSGNLSGTATGLGMWGRVNATVAVSDANGVTATYQLSQQIVLPVFAGAPDVLPSGTMGIPYAQTLAASGGVAPYRFVPLNRDCGPSSTPSSGCWDFVLVGSQRSLPPGLRLEPSGAITGTPFTAGTYTLEYIIEDATFPQPTNTFSFSAISNAVHRVQITISPSATVLSIGNIPMPHIDVPYSQQLVVTGGTAPYHFQVVSGGLPRGLTLTPDGRLSGTPTAENLNNFLDFTIGVTDSAQPTNAGSSRYVWRLSPQTVFAGSRTVAATAGLPVKVDLNLGSTGGPFTDAAIVDVTPANAGHASIARIDAVGGARYELTYTPLPAFSGSVAVRYTLSEGSQTSEPGIITIDVAPRPDPSSDPDVRGLHRAQIDAARRFASTQTMNFGRRLERLHDDGSRRSLESSLVLSVPMSCARPMSANADATAACQGSGALPMGAGSRNASTDAGSDWSVWFAGTLRSGDQDGRSGGVTHYDFETDGLSAGVDRNAGGAFTIGGGIGWAHDRSELSGNTSRSDATARSIAAYASYHPGERWFVDTLLGWQSLDYKLQRHVSATGAKVQADRSGDQWFGAVTLGAEYRHGAWRLTPYARTEYAHGRLDGYVEHGDPIFALAYGETTIDSLSANLGMRAGYRIETGWGVFQPEVRLEYQHDFHGAGDATIRYADLSSGPVYRIDGDRFGANRMSFGLGMLFEFQRGWGLHVDYRGEAGDGSRTDQAVRVDVDKRF